MKKRTLKDSKCIFVSNTKEISSLPSNRLKINYYDSDGKILEEESSAVAKETKYTKGSKFYILTSRRSKLFNPISDKINQKAKGKGGLPEFTMKEVDQKTFNRYLEFLKSKQTYILRQAELLRGL